MKETENLQANPHRAGESSAIFFHRWVNWGRTIVATAVQAFGHFCRNWAGPLTEGGLMSGLEKGKDGTFWELNIWAFLGQAAGYLLCERNFPVAWPEPSQPGIGHLRQLNCVNNNK